MKTLLLLLATTIATSQTVFRNNSVNIEKVKGSYELTIEGKYYKFSALWFRDFIYEIETEILRKNNSSDRLVIRRSMLAIREVGLPNYVCFLDPRKSMKHCFTINEINEILSKTY